MSLDVLLARFGVVDENPFFLSFLQCRRDRPSRTGAFEENVVFWIAYPKATLKKYEAADINRDTGNPRMRQHGSKSISARAAAEVVDKLRIELYSQPSQGALKAFSE